MKHIKLFESFGEEISDRDIVKIINTAFKENKKIIIKGLPVVNMVAMIGNFSLDTGEGEPTTVAKGRVTTGAVLNLRVYELEPADIESITIDDLPLETYIRINDIGFFK
jgi:hypothetical protein